MLRTNKTLKLSGVACMLSLVAAALMITGCGGVSERDLVGDWNGKMDSSSFVSTASTPEEKRMEEASMGMVSSMELPLELKDDHTFTLGMMGFPMEGTWEFEDMTLTLTSPDMTVSGSGKPLVLKIKDGGDTLEGDLPQGQGMLLVFTKKGED